MVIESRATVAGSRTAADIPSRNGALGLATPAILLNVIPMDCCPHCPTDPPHGMPVAATGRPTEGVVRYVCPQCRLIWDTSWSLGEEPFWDHLIPARAKVRSFPQQGIAFPAGPREALVGRPRAAL